MAMNDRKRQLNSVVLRRLLALAVCLLVFAGVGVPAFAAAALDPSRGTELTVELAYNGMAIPGAKFSLYRVGSIDAGAALTLEGSLVGRYDVSNPRIRGEWDQLAADMAAFCKANGIAPIAAGLTDSSGAVTFGSGSTLASGLYLVVGDEVEYQEYRYTTLPFLVSLPSWNAETGTWEYAVYASPKLDRESTTPVPVTTPVTTPGPSPAPTNPRLPQTGQLWWPVPVLLFVGLAMIVLGLVQRKRV